MLYYKEVGNRSGKPILFIHGGFTNHKTFEKQFSILSEYRCMFVDLPNCGESRGFPEFTFDTAIDQTAELIERTAGERKVILIGHSYGGLVVKGLLERIPERIEKAVIGSTNLRKSLMYRLYTSLPGAFLTWMRNREYYQKEQISFRLIYETQKSAWKHFTLPRWQGKKEDFGKEIPILLLYAEKDIPDIQKSMKLWKELLPHAQIKCFLGVGHAFFREHPELVNPVVEAFVRE